MVENKTLTITLTKPFSFEGKEYKEVDLSGIEGFTADDLEEVTNQWRIASGQGVAVLQEFDVLWTAFAAARASKLPVEFFRKLPGKDAIKVRDTISKYFRG